uniref:non-specific serine/threonine protein kinase n=1 Tax=Lotharella globosa TaxID=91324 RepID=A0A7S3ZFF9_9EUKA|mmetsp:Transcript_2369/g.4545  ORF Transcript_2369/g.4545 Transcript_2369/m.4545 type:complete len:417 (+) Transcript_2369:119-1369(+)
MDQYEFYRSFRETLYGKVRYGKHKRTGEIVVIKEFNLECVTARKSTRGIKIAEDAQQEILVHAELEKGKCPNIVGLRSVFKDHRKLYVVLEYCKNGDFFNHVAGSNFSEQVARVYFKQLLNGVAYMHSRGYAHRDLSLENILMDEKKNLKICDFGLSVKLQNPSQKLDVDDPDCRPGKIRYMPPEIFSCGEYSPFSSDLYCCGVILFVMLLGKPPYEFPCNDDERFKLIANGRLEYLLQVWGASDKLSNEVKDLLSRLITFESKRISLAEISKHPWITGGKLGGSGTAQKANNGDRTGGGSQGGGGSRGNAGSGSRGSGGGNTKDGTLQGSMGVVSNDEKSITAPQCLRQYPPQIKNQIEQLTAKTLMQYEKMQNKQILVLLAQELKKRYNLEFAYTEQIIKYVHALMRAEAQKKR